MLLAVLPSHIPMAVPTGIRLKRSRGSLPRNHKLGQHPRQRIQEADPSIIAPTARHPLATNHQSQPRTVSHRHRNKRRRLSANCAGVSQTHLPVASHPNPVFPTPPTSSAPSPPPSSSSRTDEEDRLSVISERLRLKMSNSSSTAAHGKNLTGQVCTYEDWQDIKELFTKAAEQYNGKHAPNISNPTATIRASGSLFLPHSVTDTYEISKPQKRMPSR